MTRQPLALAFFAAVILATSATAEPPRKIDLAPPTTWGAMLGLSQDQIRTRLGLSPIGETRASLGARLEDGQTEVEILVNDLYSGPCTTAPRGHYAMGYIRPARLTFRAGKLMAVHQLGREDSVDLEAPLSLSCTIHPRGGGDTGDLALLPLAVFTIPAAVGRAHEDAKGRDDWKAFSELRLGQAPPGGAEAWVAQHRDIAEIAPASGSELRLNVKVHGRRGVLINYAVLRAGQVVELHPGGFPAVCRLQDDGSLACWQMAGA